MGRGMEGEWNKMDDIRNSDLMAKLSEFSKTVIIIPPPPFHRPPLIAPFLTSSNSRDII